MRRLKVTHVPAKGQPEALFEEMWRVRRDIIDLRPEVTPEADYRVFRDYFDDDASVALVRDDAGDMQGFFGWHGERVDTGRGQRAIVDGEYLFFRKGARGSLVMAELALGCFVRSVRRFGTTAGAIVGIGYPASVMAVGRYCSAIRTVGTPGLAAWEQKVLGAFGRRAAGSDYDEANGRVRMRTLPREGRRMPRSRHGRHVLAWYETHNPSWLDGYGLAVLMPFDGASVMKGMVRAAVRR